MFERPKSGERAVLVHIDLGGESDPDELQEFTDLALSAGADPVEFIMGSRQHPDPRLFVGRGKAEEIKYLVSGEKAELVIFNHSLSPSQERNLEREFDCRVVDRTGLITRDGHRDAVRHAQRAERHAVKRVDGQLLGTGSDEDEPVVARERDAARLAGRASECNPAVDDAGRQS